MIQWEFEEAKKEWAKTVLLTKAMITDVSDQTSVQELNKSLENYRQTIFPSDESNAEMLIKYQEHMENAKELIVTAKKT